MGSMDDRQKPLSRAAAKRAERLEAEIKANLKKRKEQARARTRAGGQPAPAADDDQP